jgi:flavin reductase (DIM6/NTAB) family NADH-FMN oxidoreductase RutF
MAVANGNTRIFTCKIKYKISQEVITMPKVQLGPQTLVYPMPAFLVGANIDGKPNFMAVAWGGICNSIPPMISVAIRHQRHTNKGIKQNKMFSVNVASVDMVKEADYCGIISGDKADKTKSCGFKLFYGKLKDAPMIEQCPVNLECYVVQVIDLGSHALVIGKIEETHISDTCLTNGKPDADKIKPLIYTTGEPPYYRTLGEIVARAFSVGKEIKDIG